MELVRIDQILKAVAVTVRSAGMVVNCISVFNSIIKCVMQAKTEFCHSIKLKFYLHNSPQAIHTSPKALLNDDHLFAMSDVERALSQRRDMVISISGMGRMTCSKITHLLTLSLWNSLFPISVDSVLNHVKEVIEELYLLGAYLDIPQSSLDAIAKKSPSNVRIQRIELVWTWLNSSLRPPCWWHLVQALKEIDHGGLAEEITRRYSKCISLVQYCVHYYMYSECYINPTHDTNEYCS